MQFTTPDMREITISDKSEACDFIKDSCLFQVYRILEYLQIHFSEYR